jgi:hypothetical protein
MDAVFKQIFRESSGDRALKRKAATLRLQTTHAFSSATFLYRVV